MTTTAKVTVGLISAAGLASAIWLTRQPASLPPVTATAAIAARATVAPPVPSEMKRAESALLTTTATTAPTAPTAPVPCNADDLERAARYSKTSSYEYVAYICGDIHEWIAQTGKPRSLGILDWLAAHGHDSPLAKCSMFLDLDRSIIVGDKVELWRRADGKLDSAARLDSFSSLPYPAGPPGCAASCWMIGTIVEQNIDGWLLSSYGQRVVVQTDKNSKLIDHAGWTGIHFTFHDKDYDLPIDPKAAQQTVVASVPCWRDRANGVTAYYSASVSRVVGGT